jgi:hypothetical protein
MPGSTVFKLHHLPVADDLASVRLRKELAASRQLCDRKLCTLAPVGF